MTVRSLRRRVSWVAWLVLGSLAVIAAFGVVVAVVVNRQGRPVVIDFSESIEHARVYPMERDRDTVHRPERVDLRFPGGWQFTTEEAERVTVQQHVVLETELIDYVRIEFPWMELDRAVEMARRFRDQWVITDTNLEEWYQEKQRVGPTLEVDDSGSGARWVEGTDRSGKRLNVTFGIDGHPRLDPPYRLALEFQWLRPRSSAAG